MKIALIGYGKMGKEIEKIAQERNHTIVLKTNLKPTLEELKQADVAIEFSNPESCFFNLEQCFGVQIPVVCGTTGWLNHFEKAVDLVKQNNSAFIYASNFSLGVNIFFELNKKLAELMQNVEGYNAQMEEIHHTQKLDAPSGTAITLTEPILEKLNYTNWALTPHNKEGEFPVTAVRKPNVPGTHIIEYTSGIDEIKIEHKAKNRKGFALGAVIAAEFLKGKKGVFTMKDVLNVK